MLRMAEAQPQEVKKTVKTKNKTFLNFFSGWRSFKYPNPGIKMAIQAPQKPPMIEKAAMMSWKKTASKAGK